MPAKNITQPIKSMPGTYRYTIDKLGTIINKAIKNKIPMVALFPSINKKYKNKFGNEALNEDNLICKAIKYIKKNIKMKLELCVMLR